MRKKISTLVLAGAALLASCSQDEMMTGGEAGLQPVTLSVSLDKGVQTRAANAQGDEQVSRCLVQILDSEGNPIDGYTTAQTMEGSEEGGYSKTVVLNEENTYTLLFWADRGDGNYTATDLKNVSKANEADAAEAIAYAAKAEWSASSGRNITATLKHVVSKLTVRTTAAVTGGTLKIEVPKVYSTYNVLDMQPGTETDLPYTKALTDVQANADVCAIYALVGSEAQNLTLTYNSAEEEVPNVPLAPNKHVILKGNVNEIGGNLQVTMNATIEPDWNSEAEKDWDGVKPEVGDYYFKDGTYSSAKEDGEVIGVVCHVNETAKTASVISLKEGSGKWCLEKQYENMNTWDMTGLKATDKIIKYVEEKWHDLQYYPIFYQCQELRKSTDNERWYIPNGTAGYKYAAANMDTFNPKLTEAGGDEFTAPSYDEGQGYWLSGNNNTISAMYCPNSDGTGAYSKNKATVYKVRFFLDFNY